MTDTSGSVSCSAIAFSSSSLVLIETGPIKAVVTLRNSTYSSADTDSSPKMSVTVTLCPFSSFEI